MRIAFLCKRRYMGKDVILDRYARLYEIPFQLARLGHDVQGFCVDYRPQDSLTTSQLDDMSAATQTWEHRAEPGRLRWESQGVRASELGKLSIHPFRMLRRLKDFQPDVLIGASDIPHVAFTAWLARRLDVPYAVDLYDNFEGFGQARIPGFKSALRRATRNAGAVFTTSEPLRQLVVNGYRAQGPVISMPSSVDLQVFQPGDMQAARAQLNLPLDAVLIGTAGGLYKDKGVATLYEAWSALSQQHPQLHLVLAGPYHANLPPPEGERVHYLGHLAHPQVPTLFQALDVGVISILDTPFGRYCFPQKAYEMLACGLRVIATDIGEMTDLFSTSPGVKFIAGNPQSLAAAASRQLTQPVFHEDIRVRDWQALIKEIEPVLHRLTRTTSSLA